MKRLLAILIVIAGTAHAQTLGSYVGTSTVFANTPILCAGKPVLAYNSTGTTIPTSTYVTNAQGSQPSGTVVCTTTFTGNMLNATGTLNFQGDDSVTVALNGTLLGKTGYNTPTTVPISGGVNGLNTLTFTVVNVVGFMGFDFVATVLPVSAPPVNSILTYGWTLTVDAVTGKPISATCIAPVVAP